MSERIDHVAEARRLEGGARSIVRAINGDPALQPHMAAVIMLDDARLEAQLAIAEQLRIQNLIALGSLTAWESELPGHPIEHLAFAAIGDPDSGELRPEIREALGL